VTDFNVGDKVGIALGNGWGPNRITGRSVITKINGHGHIVLENGRRFKRGGNGEFGDEYSRAYLVSNDAAEKMINQREIEKRTNDSVKALSDALDAIKNNKVNGTYIIYPQDKVNLLALVDALVVNAEK
jgi:hypothetical protein